MMLQLNSYFSARCALGITALLATSSACAQIAPMPSSSDGQVVTPYAQYSLTYDDNVLRLRDAAAAQNLFGDAKMSDSYRTAVGGLRIDKLISRQRFRLDASVNKTSFDYFKQFDNNGHDVKGSWSWVAGPYLTGDLGLQNTQALTPFQNLRVFQRNIRTQKSEYATAALRMHPDWTLRAQFTRFDLGYSLASQQVNNFTQDVSEVGLDYTARSGSVAGIQLRHTSGDYPASTVVNGVTINNSFTQDEVKAKVLWLYSGKTRLQFLGGMVQRSRQMGGEGNFNGFNARLIGDWYATGKTAFTVNLWREIGGLSDLDANYALTNGASLGATWQSTAKLRFDGFVDYEKRNYNGATIIAGVTPSGRRDRYERATLSLTYMPITSLSLIAAVFRESLQSNIDSFSYVSNGVALTTRYEF